MQTAGKGQIPALHPAKELVEDVAAENRLLQLLFLKANSAWHAGVVYALTHFYHNKKETLKVKTYL